MNKYKPTNKEAYKDLINYIEHNKSIDKRPVEIQVSKETISLNELDTKDQDNEQKKINKRAQHILDICSKNNSSSCVLSLIAVIEHIAFNEKSNIAFKKKTALLLSEQSLRIISSMQPNNKIN